MAGLTSRYKKKSSLWLLAIGFALAATLSTRLSRTSHTISGRTRRPEAAVIAVADSIPAPSESAASWIVQDVAKATDQLQQIGLPIGWPDGPQDDQWWGWWITLHILGWLMTGLLGRSAVRSGSTFATD